MSPVELLLPGTSFGARIEVLEAVVHNEGEFGGNVDIRIRANPAGHEQLRRGLEIALNVSTKSMPSIAHEAKRDELGLTFYLEELDGMSPPPGRVHLSWGGRQVASVECGTAPPV